MPLSVIWKCCMSISNWYNMSLNKLDWISFQTTCNSANGLKMNRVSETVGVNDMFEQLIFKIINL
jgi:hypothetical protein